MRTGCIDLQHPCVTRRKPTETISERSKLRKGSVTWHQVPIDVHSGTDLSWSGCGEHVGHVGVDLLCVCASCV